MPSFLAEGVHHIATGYDHVLFLMCLLLPSVMRRTPAGWVPVARLRDALLSMAMIVTAFTVAHSITLALAAWKLVSLPAALIEPAIAATIVLAALDNLRPIFGGRRALVAFFFGLVHGFGFANVLGELDLPTALFAWALLQFNLGLDLGQLAIVAAAAAALYPAAQAAGPCALGDRRRFRCRHGNRHAVDRRAQCRPAAAAALRVAAIHAEQHVLAGRAGAPRHGCRAMALRYNLGIRTCKDGKGIMVMTPRTTGFLTET